MTNFFSLPGDYVLNLLAQEAPGLASLLGLARPEDSIVFTIVLSTFLWILVVVLFGGGLSSSYKICAAFRARSFAHFGISSYKALETPGLELFVI